MRHVKQMLWMFAAISVVLTGLFSGLLTLQTGAQSDLNPTDQAKIDATVQARFQATQDAPPTLTVLAATAQFEAAVDDAFNAQVTATASMVLPQVLKNVVPMNGQNITEFRRLMYGFNVSGRVNSVVFSPDGTLMATGNGDGTVRLWNLDTLEEIEVLQAGDEQSVYAISPDNRYLWAGKNGCDTWLWNLDMPEKPVSSHGCNENIRLLSDGIHLIRVAQEVTVSVASTVTSPDDFTVQSSFELSSVIDQGYSEYRVSPDGTLLAVLLGSGTNTQVNMVDLIAGEVLYTLRDPNITHVIFSPDSQLVALSHSDKTIGLWELASQTKLHDLVQEQDRLIQAIFSPDNSLFIARSYAGVETQQFWDVKTGELRRSENLPYIEDMDFRADNTLIAVADYDGVRLWGISR